MELQFYFLWLCMIPYSLSFVDTHWNLLIFTGEANNSFFFERQLKLPYSFTTPQIFYFFNENEFKNLSSPLNRPFLLKSANVIHSHIVLGKLESIKGISNNLERILTPKSNPMILKDEEKVVLHVRNWTEDEIVDLMKSFGKKLKYKLALSYESSSGIEDPVLYKSCEYCKLRFGIFRSDSEWTDYEKDFEGTPLLITTPASARPRLNYTLGPDGKYRMVNGLLMYLVKYMQKNMNFSVNLKPAGRGGGTGIQFPNGSWTGIMSEILNGEVDIGMCTAETYNRSLITGFTPAVVTEPVLFISGPPHKIFVWKAIFWPFKSEVWTLLAGVVLVSVALIRFSYFVLKIPQEKRWKTSKTLGFILEILLDNSGKIPKYLPVSIRFHVIIWILCGSIITTAYLSKLVGFLTFPQLEKVPETAEELVESKYSWGLTYFGGVLYLSIKASKIKAYEQVLSKMELRPDIIGCLSQTLDTKYICISYEIISKFYVNSRTDIKNNPFTFPKNPFVVIPVGIVMEKRAIFGPNLKASIRSSDSAGLYSYWEKLDFRKVRQSILKKEKTRKPQLGKTDVSSVEDNEGSLTMQHLRGAFTVFIAGLVVAWIVFVFEKIISCT